MADEANVAGEKPALQKVYVRSIPRAGFGGSYRAGRFFSSAEFTEVEDTPETIKLLRADAGMLIVLDQKPSGDAIQAAPSGEALPLQPGAPPGSPPPVDTVYRQGEGSPAPHDAFGMAGDKGGKGPQGRR